MGPDVRASRLLVLSDLHLAPSSEQSVFTAHAALVALIDHLAAAPKSDPPQWLVLNGDVFDFLLLPGYDSLSLPLAPQRMSTILDALDGEPPDRNLVQALRRFVAAGHVLSCLPGNHDAELNLAGVQQVLAQRLGCGASLPPSEGFWRIEAAGRTVVGMHGHHDDAFNAIGGAQMCQAQADGDETVPMPPGSRLVCQTINPFRRAQTRDGAKRFPFIDRLPSERAVVLAIMLLDPGLAGKRLANALGISAAALVRKALMATGAGGPMLGPADALPGAEPEGTDWIGELQACIASAAVEQGGVARPAALRIEHELDAYFAGQMPVAQVSSAPGGAAMLAEGMFTIRGLLWRALGHALAATRSSFRSAEPDRLARKVQGSWGPGIVAVTGHTHAAKSMAASDGGIYVNTGSWLDQVLPPPGDDVAALPGWLDKLQRDDLPTWNGRPVALVDAEGARLMSWDGRALVPWRDA